MSFSLGFLLVLGNGRWVKYEAIHQGAAQDVVRTGEREGKEGAYEFRTASSFSIRRLRVKLLRIA